FFVIFLSNEYSKGTLVIMLTKGLSRSSIVLSKFSVTVIIMTIGFWLSFLFAYGYTMYFWPTANL
ncbi:ABC transporter permease, partial [Clostridioides difficile]